MTPEEFKEALKDLRTVIDNSSNIFPYKPSSVDLCQADVNNYDPTANMNQNAPMTLEGIEDLINSDEIQGLLNLDVDSLERKIASYIEDPLNNKAPNLSDIPANKNPDDAGCSDNWAIVEYGDDYIKDKKVEYTLDIEPGDVLTSETMIGTVEQEEKMLPLKSIFSSGYVCDITKTDKDGNEYKDFMHLFPKYADRHFLIHNYTLSQGDSFTQKDQDEMKKVVLDNTNLYNLIKDNAVYSTFPVIIDFHEKKSEHPVPPLFCTLPHGNTVYANLVQEYEDYLQNAGKGLQKLCSEDRIKATGARKDDMKNLAFEVIAERENILDTVIRIYRKGGTRKICYKDVEPNWLSVSGYSVDVRKKTGNIFKGLYQNYYVYLLSMVDISQEDNKANKEYYDLLDGIIQNRIKKEYISKDDIIGQFNTLYNTYIEKKETRGYQKLIAEFTERPTKTAAEIALYISQVTYFKDIKNDTEVTQNLLKWCQALANMFLYITTLKKTESVKESDKEKLDIEALVKEEANKIKSFWEEKIKKYKATPINAVIATLQQKGEELQKYAKWPEPRDITICGQLYKHYLFKNPFKENETGNNNGSGNGNGVNGNGDGDAAAQDYQAAGSAATPDSTIPDAPDGAAAADALNSGKAADQSESDPKQGEITIMDTEYWMKYYSLATIISLPFLADGFDIPPTMTPVPMPGIYICISAIPVVQMDMLMVIGLAIRGIYIYPIIQVHNLSSNALTPLTPIVAILKKIQDMFHNAIGAIEMCIPNVAGILIDKLQRDNQKLAEENARLTAAISGLMNQAIEDKAIIKKTFERMVHPKADYRQNIARTEKLT